MEKTTEKVKKMYMAFVDLEEVHDNMSKEKLWKLSAGGVYMG